MTIKNNYQWKEEYKNKYHYTLRLEFRIRRKSINVRRIVNNSLHC